MSFPRWQGHQEKGDRGIHMHQPSIVVIGSLNIDIVIEAERSPQLGETILGKEAHFIPGGKGANQAVATARLGTKTMMIGAVGKDDFGTSLITNLEKEGVKTDAIQVIAGVATGLASILVTQGDNHIVVIPGANAQCLPKDLEGQQDSISQADIVLLQLEIPLETVCRAAELAKQLGKVVILNPAPAQKLPYNLLQNVDYITPNRSELALLSGITITDHASLERAMKTLLEMGPKHVITTLGSDGSAFLSHREAFTLIPSYHVPVVDTTGAGDSFNGGLAVALASGKDLREAVEYAGRVSALAVTKFGAQGGMPTKQEVEAFSYPYHTR